MIPNEKQIKINDFQYEINKHKWFRIKTIKHSAANAVQSKNNYKYINCNEKPITTKDF